MELNIEEHISDSLLSVYFIERNLVHAWSDISSALSPLTTLDLSAMESEYLLLPNVKHYFLKLQKATEIS